MYWQIAPEWQGQTAFIIAGGPSIKNQNLNLLRGRRVLALNSSYIAAPWADILFFQDRRWTYEHWQRPDFLAFAGRKVTCSSSEVCETNFTRLRRIVPNLDPAHGALGPGLATERNAVVSNRTCLQGGMNILAHLGVGRIGLLGADACRAEDGSTHHHTPHKWKNKPGNVTWDIQLTQLALTVEPLKALGIEVVNLSPISRIPFWPKMTLEEFLCIHAQSSIAFADPAESTDPPTLPGCESKSEIATLSP